MRSPPSTGRTLLLLSLMLLAAGTSLFIQSPFQSGTHENREKATPIGLRQSHSVAPVIPGRSSVGGVVARDGGAPLPTNAVAPAVDPVGMTRHRPVSGSDITEDPITRWGGVFLEGDTVIGKNNRRIVRRLYETPNVIGRVLVHEYPEAEPGTDQQAYFSGSLIVVSLSAARDPDEWVRLLEKAGLQVDVPAHSGRFLRVRIPEGGLDRFDATIAAVAEIVGMNAIHLDGIGWGATAPPNDTWYGDQWNLSIIEMEPAWGITTGSSRVTVAILDSGIEAGLIEFSGRLLPGYDFVNTDADPDDDSLWDGYFTGHGTAVASILGANANNEQGIAGVDWNCKILPVKVLDSDLSGTYSVWAEAVDYAVAHGADVINLSAGGPGNSPVLRQAIQDAIASGVIFVTVTHNDGNASVSFPGSMEQAITVGATNQLDSRTNFSNNGKGIDLVAPGLSVHAVADDGAVYNDWQGTSFAAPLVSGVASLLLSLRPDLDQEAFFRLLSFAADDQVGSPFEDVQGYDGYHGWGRLNARKTLELIATRPEVAITGTGDGGASGVVVSWPVIEDPSGKDGYQIEYSDDLVEWHLVMDPTLVIRDGQATWVDDGTDLPPIHPAGRFYRIGLRAFKVDGSNFVHELH